MNEVPPLAEKGRTLNDEYVGIWDPHGNPAGGPPLPNKEKHHGPMNGQVDPSTTQPPQPAPPTGGVHGVGTLRD